MEGQASTMLHPFIFLLFVIPLSSPNLMTPNPLKYGCQPGKPKECGKAPFVPGHTLLGEGLDIVTMKRTGAFLLDLQTYQKKNKTCTLCKNIHRKNALEKIPIAMVDWRPETSCSRSITGSISHSKVSLANQETSSITNDWRAGLDVSDPVNKVSVASAGSHSRMAEFAETKTITDKYEFLSTELQCSYYSFRLSLDAPLSPDFVKALRQLPASYNKEDYRSLISTYGTHYITQAKIGGRIKEVTAVQTCQVAMNSLKMSDMKDCLELEAAATTKVKTEDVSADMSMNLCMEKAKNLTQGNSFRTTFNERMFEVKGGKATFNLFDEKSGGKPEEFSAWMESLKTIPDLVAFSLSPIHNLVRLNGPQKNNVKKAVSDYINEKALRMKCSCSGNSHPSRNGDCSCVCPATKYSNSECCPTNKGLAHLTLYVDSATGLYGDYFGKSDAYVKFKFDRHEERSKTVWNNDNPVWKEDYNIGMVELTSVKKFTIEVWDQDYGYDDDLLGKCSGPLTSGFNKKTCNLNDGSFSYSLNVTCVTHLRGDFCQDYSPVPP
ncbi:perforin-1 [Xenopus tropicalis]|uniref:Perforin-1 n=3 Tax=Xenopus tropicalis TaxID=8364 RepID=A0A8J1IXY0_XENTR|nr:perforin-1 [Xenopus tropicalis]